MGQPPLRRLVRRGRVRLDQLRCGCLRRAADLRQHRRWQLQRLRDAQVDELANTLVKTLDPDEQVNLQKQIDPLLFADAYGLPLFQSVGVDAVSDRVGGIADYNPSQSGVWWNVWDWTVNDG